MKDLLSLSETVHTSQYRMADVVFFPIGDRRVLIGVGDTETMNLLQEVGANLLKQCNEFKTIDEHVDNYCRKLQLNGTMLESIRDKLQHQLQQLAQEGYLISSSQLRQLFQESSEQVSLSPITSIVFPTGNRVEALQRGMISYLEHCQHFGRTLDFVVADDSETPATREAYRQMLRSLKARYGVNMAYAGLEEKTMFAKKLSKVGDIPQEIVSWACIGNREYGVGTYGANRNALLLHTVGERILSTDDDIICRMAASPGIKEGLALGSRGNPSEFWFYPDRASALESVQFVEQDILALHEQWLGQDPRASIASYSRDDLLSFEQAEPSFLHRLATRPSTIAVTGHGRIGDIALGKTSGPPLFLVGESFKRLTSSEQAYRSARVSREVARVVNQITIMEKAYPIITTCGLDNREFLPPFPPVGRAEDDAFNLILTKCFPDAYTIFLPWILIHAPLDARSFSEHSLDITIYKCILACINIFDAGFASTATDRLSKLGEFLDEIGRLSTASFTSLTRQLFWHAWGLSALEWEKKLHSDQESFPLFWRRDVEAYFKRMRQSMLLSVEQLICGAPGLLQRSLVQFAQILKWWPAIVETAKRLRADGYRLAQPI